MAVKVKKINSLAELRAELDRSNVQYLTRVPVHNSEQPFVVRILTEPDSGTWMSYQEHYSDTKHYFPCSDTDCTGCDEGLRKSSRYLIPVLIRDEDKVVPCVMPQTLVDSLMEWYNKYNNTLLDRDYTLKRKGSGQMNTKYTSEPEDPMPLNLGRYKVPDMQKVLNAQIPGASSDTEDESEASTPLTKVAPPAVLRRPVATDEAPKPKPRPKTLRRE